MKLDLKAKPRYQELNSNQYLTKPKVRVLKESQVQLKPVAEYDFTKIKLVWSVYYNK